MKTRRTLKEKLLAVLLALAMLLPAVPNQIGRAHVNSSHEIPSRMPSSA